MFMQPTLVNRALDDLVFRITESAIFHSFRRMSARDKRVAGVAASVIMEEAGWKSESQAI